jgi:hypothetical protein
MSFSNKITALALYNYSFVHYCSVCFLHGKSSHLNSSLECLSQVSHLLSQEFYRGGRKYI